MKESDRGAGRAAHLGRAMLGTLALITSGALVLAACGTSSAAAASRARPAAKVVRGGVVTWAELPATVPDYIFPFMSASYDSVQNTDQFQYLMYRPLYWFGVGEKPILNPSISLAAPPVFRDHDTEVVVNLKHYRWSNGETVDARDVMFWMNMLKVEKQNTEPYVPGGFPDDVKNVVPIGQYQLDFYLTRSYNPDWFTSNELSQVTAMPVAWDVTSPTGAPGSGGCSGVSYSSVTTYTNSSGTVLPKSKEAKDCAAVYDFLSIQSGFDPKDPSATTGHGVNTFASNPLWKVVDGPWRLLSLNATGKVVFVPNARYSGAKPHISRFIELPFTSDTAEFDALAAGAVDVGYLPPADVTSPAPHPGAVGPNNPSLSGKYHLRVGFVWGLNYMALNLADVSDGGVAGRILSQLYIRQAMQSLIDEPVLIKKIYKNYAAPMYGPVPIDPPTYATSYEKSNPYPYDAGKARELLLSHGWHLVPNGISSCAKGGPGRGHCGVGIPKGAKLQLSLYLASGMPALSALMNDETSAWTGALGMKVSQIEGTFSATIGELTCAKNCPWGLIDWGAGDTYSPDYYPTGGTLFATGGAQNFGHYENAHLNSLVSASHFESGPAAFDAYENYVTTQLPDLWEPNPVNAYEVKNSLHIGAINPLDAINPEDWYYTK